MTIMNTYMFGKNRNYFKIFKIFQNNYIKLTLKSLDCSAEYNKPKAGLRILAPAGAWLFAR